MEFDPRLVHPFPCVIAGPTGSGKTEFIKRLLTTDSIVERPQRIVWCYGAGAAPEERLPDVEYVEGFEDQGIDGRLNTLIVVDDLMSELTNDKRLSDLFCKKSHHLNCSVVFVTQNLFAQGSEMRTVARNAHYLVLFKNPRDAAAVNYLARQMYPENARFMVEAYRLATERPHGYLFVDLKQTTPESVRLRADIFERNIAVYAPRTGQRL